MQKFLKSAVFGAVAVTTVAGSALAADVTMGIRSEPSSVDPYFHNLGPNNAMLGQVFGRLLD
ncbi:MAG: ABC transporter substrate-binding protein, partial [Alphaproteobacteria bacterium]|nr:ABC transporter substrate-binding protein [Alphaproteobacteria bacterium]